MKLCAEESNNEASQEVVPYEPTDSISEPHSDIEGSKPGYDGFVQADVNGK